MGESRCRELVRERSCGLCESCGARPAREMHHRKNRSQGGVWSEANIVHLCGECHRFVTVNPAAGRRSGLSLLRCEDPAVVAVLLRGQWTVLRDDGTVEWVA